jgi:hypothetical protein
VLVISITEFVREEKPEIQLIASVGLIALRYADDKERTVLNKLFGAVANVVSTVDEGFIGPNTEKLFIRPSTRLLKYGIDTLQHSKSISSKDRNHAFKSLGKISSAISKAQLDCIKQQFQESVASNLTMQKMKKVHNLHGGNSLSTTPVKAVKCPPLNFSTLRRYFDTNNLDMSDDQVVKILTKFEGRDANLRLKLEEKFKYPVEDQVSVSTPKSVDGHVGTLKNHNLSNDNSRSISTDPVLRRRPVVSGWGAIVDEH